MPSSRRRARELARQRYERRQARRTAARERRRRVLSVVSAAVAVAAVIGGVAYAGVAFSGGGKHHPAPSPSPSAVAAANQCLYRPMPASGPNTVRNVGIPSSDADRTTPYLMTITTNHGVIRIQLLTSQAPCTVNSFRFLAARHYFDRTPCHRLTSTQGLFVLQCGDPFGTGAGGPGYQFDDENLTGATYTTGTVAMANSGPNTNGSQFFIVYRNSQLSPQYTPFGRVLSGLSVVDAIARGGSVPAGDGRPRIPVTIDSLTVIPG